jgi:hypothetical protein
MSKFNSTSTGKSAAKRTVSKDGVSAWKSSAYQDLCDRVLTSFYGEDRFYESGKESADNIISLIKTVATEDPVFVGKLAVIAREQFNLRSVSQVLAAELSKIHKGDSLVSQVVERIAKRPDDLTELVAYLLQDAETVETADGLTRNRKRKLRNSVKKGIAKSLVKLDEYQWSKYSGNGKDVKLTDLLNLVHPKPLNQEQSDMWKRAFEGKLKVAETWERKISEAGQGNKTESEKADAKKENWESMILNKKLGYMALLRNIRNIIEAGVSNEAHQMAQDYLSNEFAVLKSKQFPFRFFSAYKVMQSTHGLDPFVKKGYLKALGKALSYSGKNISPLKGRTVLVTDLSASMDSSISGDSTVTCKEVGAVLSSLASQFCEDSIVCGFGSTFQVIPVSEDSNRVLEDADKIMKTNVGHATNAHLVMQYLIQNKIEVDQIMLFTDMQLNGSYSYGGNSLEADIKLYRQRVNKDARIYELNLCGYGSTQINPRDPNYVHMSGWNESVLKYITEYQSLKNGIVDMVKGVTLTVV